MPALYRSTRFLNFTLNFFSWKTLQHRHSWFAAAVLAIASFVAGNSLPAQAKTATTTTLAVTAAGSPVTKVSAGTVVTLTSIVKAGATALTKGQVNFCDAAVSYCTDIHLLGTAQLTSEGTATFKFRPSIGSHSYKAIFLGTKSDSGSASNISDLSVTGTIGMLKSQSTIAETGSWGKYILTGTVTESGNTVPITGSVAFKDTSHSNAVLATASLGANVASLDWPNPIAMTMPTNSPRALAIGDFNGDGIADLAIMAGGPMAPLIIMLGNADGSYTEAPPLSSLDVYSFGPMVVGDFNGDGKQDLAVLNGDASVVTILLGNGDGTFTVAPSSPSIGANPSQIAEGDFNGDGIMDLVVTTGSTTPLVVLLGNGDGTFTTAPALTAASSAPYSIGVGDFNGDGKLDFVVSDLYTDTISVFLGNGDGTFATPGSLISGTDGPPLAVADFNRDGKLDLAVAVMGATGAPDSVRILTGNGDGTFNVPTYTQSANIGTGSFLQVGDFNADGIADLGFMDSAAGIFNVFLDDGTGSFTTAASSELVIGTWGAYTALGDLNGDGRSDILLAPGSSDIVSVYLTQPTETATATATLAITNAGQNLVDASYAGSTEYAASLSSTIPLWGVPQATTTTLAVNADGKQVTSVTPGTLVELIATVKIGTTPLTKGQVNFCDASAVDCTDIHHIGTAPLLSNGTASWKFIPGAGTHSYKAVYAPSGYGLASASAAESLTVDPAPAPVYTDSTTLTYSGYPGEYSLTATVEGFGGPAALTGNVSFVDASFSNTILATAPLGASTPGIGWNILQTQAMTYAPFSEVAGDFNGDGIPDLALLWAQYSYSGPQNVTILLGKGDGSFTTGPTTQLSASQSSTKMISGDFNGDGKLDIVLLNEALESGGSAVTTLLGHGDGTFSTPKSSTIYTPPQSGGDFITGDLVAADFNGDGKLDLAVVGNYVSGGVTIALGNGDGTFTSMIPSILEDQSFGVVATGDFNGDGIPDLVAASYYAPTGAAVLLGKGDGTFTLLPTLLQVDTFPYSIIVGDFNGDGKADLAFGYTGAIQVFLGNGDGTFSPSAGTQIDGAGLSLVAGDFNHDGKLDLAGLDTYNNQIDIFVGAGDGTFTETVTTPNINQQYSDPKTIFAADFNNDGVPDLALLINGIDTATILLTKPTETASATVKNIAPIGAGTHNVDASYTGNSNYPASLSPIVALSAGLTPVVISPASGIFTSAQSITLTESIPGSTIYYVLYGAMGTGGSVQYTGPIALEGSGTLTIEAYATETGYVQSNLTTATFVLNFPAAPAPVFSLAAGTYSGTQTLTITDAVPGAKIYYSTNGVLAANTIKYTKPITISTSETIAAYAIAPEMSSSSVTSAQYIISTVESSFIYTIAGNGIGGYSGDGGLATQANLNYPQATVFDKAGDLYIADAVNNVVRKIAAGTGIITTVAGTGIAGYSGDNGPATSAQLSSPNQLSLDGSGNLWILDNGNGKIRMVATATGKITTFNIGSLIPTAFVLHGSKLYLAAENNVYSISSAGVATIVAGTNNPGYFGDNGPAISARLNSPFGIAFDDTGNLYIADSGNSVIRKVNMSTGVITTVAGNSTGEGEGYAISGYSGDGDPATSADLYIPEALTIDSHGNLYIADTYNSAIRKVTASTGIITTIAGNGAYCTGYGGDGGPATSASLCFPQGVALDSAGDLFITSTLDHRIRKVTVPAHPPTAVTAAPVLSVTAGTYSTPQSVIITDATPGAEIYVSIVGPSPSRIPLLAQPGYYNGPINVSGSITIQAVAVAPGYLPSALVTAAYTIKTPPTAVISTVAGSGNWGFYGNGGPATSALFGDLTYLALDSSQNLYFSDNYNFVVWKLSATTGKVAIFAGNGMPGSNGDKGPATSAELYWPDGLAVDHLGNLYIADCFNNKIRFVTAATGIITTIAGTGNYGYPGSNGDGGPATAASFACPAGIVLDSAGNLYIVDSNENSVRKITAATGIITTIAGGNAGIETAANNGDGGPATSAILNYPSAIAIDAHGNLYITDQSGGRVRKIAKATNIITTVAGNGNQGYDGDGASALKAEVFTQGIAFNQAGNLFLSNYSGAVREVNTSTGIIQTVAGYGVGNFNGNGLSATVAGIGSPFGIVFDPEGNLYIADSGNYRIRKLTYPAPAPTPTFSVAAGTYHTAQSVTISDSNAGATIYYTKDGSTPTTASILYNGPITVSATEMLKAIAKATGYTLSAVASAAYTINAVQAITFTQPSSPVTYGVSPITLSASASSGLPVTFSVAGPATLNGSTLSITGVGTVEVTAKQDGNTDYAAAAAVTHAIEVDKASLKVTAVNASVAFNQPIPKLTYTVTGFVNGDTASVLSGAPVETTTAKQGSAAGKYPITITAGTLSATNYGGFVMVNGTLTITQ